MPPPKNPSAEHLIAKIQGFRGTPFEYVDGLGGVIDVVEFKDGPDTIVRKRPGHVVYDRVILRRQRSGRPVLWEWWKAATAGAQKRREVNLGIQDVRGRTIASWTLLGCWPCRWRLAHGVEEVTLVVEDIRLD